jgi:TonB family protein
MKLTDLAESPGPEPLILPAAVPAAPEEKPPVQPVQPEEIAGVITGAAPGDRITGEPENKPAAAAEAGTEDGIVQEDQTGAGTGGFTGPPERSAAEDEYLPAHRLSELPKFPESKILAALVYPPIARRSGIQGWVMLELFVDRTGVIRRIDIVQEEPAGRGFGEAARAAFRDILCEQPATVNGQNVPARVSYPLNFKLR